MSDLISRQAAVDKAERECKQDGAYGYMDIKSIIDMLEDLPPAQPERKTGRWIQNRMPVTGAIEMMCSVCGTPFYMAFASSVPFCPNCGARMKEEEVR